MNVATLFWQSCDSAPCDAVAIATESMTRTYADLGRRVARLTHALVARGVRPGDRVGILGRNGPEYCEAYWACVSVGATVVALNFRLARAELERVCAFSDLQGYLCAGEFVDLLVGADAALGRKFVVCWGPADEGAARDFEPFEPLVLGSGEEGGEAAPVLADVPDEALYALIFTGGTSGTPKAVGRSHRNAMSTQYFTLGNALGGRQRVLLSCTPVFHIAGQSALFTLAQSGTLVMIEGSFGGTQFLRLVSRFGVQAAFVVPAMVAAIARAEGAEAYDVSSLRELRSGGAPLPVEVARQLIERFPNIRFSNGAGSTEAGTMGSGWWDDLRQREFGCVGRPPVGQEVRILNEHGVEAAVGEMGEIVIRGAQLARGYWNDADRSAAVFVDGWQRSADLGRVDSDGYLYLVDRKSDMIISGGENVYAREVEEALYRVPRVKEAAVLGVPHEKWGEVPLAVLVTADGSEATEDIVDALADSLAVYKRPHRYVFVNELPRTPVGKVDKLAVRAMLRS